MMETPVGVAGTNDAAGQGSFRPGKARKAGGDVFARILSSRLATADKTAARPGLPGAKAFALPGKPAAEIREDNARKAGAGQGVLIAEERNAKARVAEKIDAAKGTARKIESAETRAPRDAVPKEPAVDRDGGAKVASRVEVKNAANAASEAERAEKAEKPAKAAPKAKEAGERDADRDILAATLASQGLAKPQAGRVQAKASDDGGDAREVSGDARKSKSKTGERLSLSVTDLRTEKVEGEVKAPQAEKSRVETSGDARESSRDLILVMSDPRDRPDGLGARSVERKDTSFRQVLERELRENYNVEIAKTGSIVLKDGGAGTIRLALKPESLGNVKFELSLAENSITGKIVVESDEAKAAFERNIASLEAAFRDQGFDAAKLQVSVGGRDSRGFSGSGGDDGPKPFFSERMRRVSEARIDGNGLALADGSLDITV